MKKVLFVVVVLILSVGVACAETLKELQDKLNVIQMRYEMLQQEQRAVNAEMGNLQNQAIPLVAQIKEAQAKEEKDAKKKK
jgi:hypothetical protein